MRYKEATPYFIEILETTCPHCGGAYIDKDLGWRDKSFDDKGLSHYEFCCQKVDCKKLFKLRL